MQALGGIRTGWAWLGLVGLVAAGCRPAGDVVVSTLHVQQQGWDTLVVDVRFSLNSRFGSARNVVPEKTSIALYNAAYDTLYADSSRIIPLSDMTLGNRERLLVEVCGTFEALVVCEQDAVAASPKRLHVDHDIAFAEDGAYERGSYDLRFSVERQVFGTDEWEPIRRRDRIHGYLRAYVGDSTHGAVQVPFSRPRGRFDLTRQAHYADFRYYLKSALMDADEAPIYVDVFAGLEGDPAGRLATEEYLVQARTPEEQREDVRYFAEQAARKILDVLEADAYARVYVDDWNTGQYGGTYSIDLTFSWRSGRGLFGRRYELGGILEVGEDGRGAQFRRTRANDRAMRLWRTHVGEAGLLLGSLEQRTAPQPRADREEGPPLRVDRGW